MPQDIERQAFGESILSLPGECQRLLQDVPGLLVLPQCIIDLPEVDEHPHFPAPVLPLPDERQFPL